MKKPTYTKETMSLDDFKDFIKKVYTGKYKDKYTLDESSWVNEFTPMKIHCSEHGWFERVPMEFAQGFVCPYESNAMKTNNEWQRRAFIEKSKAKFGDRFEHPINFYPGYKEEITIVCKKHGEFKTTPCYHLQRVDGGCLKCYNDNMCQTFTKGSEVFIKESKEIWGENTFDYSKVNYVNRNTHITLVCKKHNIEFQQIPYKHLLHHQQCPECLREANIERNLMETKTFIKKAVDVHKGRYGYELSSTKNRNSDGKIAITCPTNGIFWQNPNDHLYGHCCPKCGTLISYQEESLKNFIKSKLPHEEIIENTRGIIDGKELDIYIPTHQLAIEYNGINWHTEQFNRDKYYHLNKLEACNQKGIKLIQIFEDEWREHQDIVLNKIRHCLKINKCDKKIRGHKCIVREINMNEAKLFFETNHIQGYGRASIIFGAYYQNELVGACALKKEHKEGYYELVRMATKINYLCHGVCGKLFKAFVDTYTPIEVKSFADRRWTLNEDNNLYTALGFKLEDTLKPDYRYVVGLKRLHKFNFRKSILHKKYGLPLTMTESEMCQTLGFDKIWDCGLFKYVWRR